jgi:hypothetical protein
VRVLRKRHKRQEKRLAWVSGIICFSTNTFSRFVEFETKDDAIKAIDAMQGYNLDDHSLLLKFSTGAGGKKQEELQQATPGKQKIGTKLMIRNIPFEATKREIRALFTPFAQVLINLFFIVS